MESAAALNEFLYVLFNSCLQCCIVMRFYTDTCKKNPNNIYVDHSDKLPPPTPTARKYFKRELDGKIVKWQVYDIPGPSVPSETIFSTVLVL